MGPLRTFALLALLFSSLTFIALFGHIPRLRKTPIGYTHRLLRHGLPRILHLLDALTYGLPSRFGRHLVNDKHPYILIFYLTLVTVGIFYFLRDGWRYLSLPQRLLAALTIPLPYITLYLAAYTDPGLITPRNADAAVAAYEYDGIIFPPSPPPCRTCRTPKPARSKHCSVCRGCVARHDHHCVWINNCVGARNVRWFLAFLASTNLLLAEGAALSFSVLTTVIRRARINPGELTWGEYAPVYMLAILREVYIGAVLLICVLCGLMAAAFTAYHVYLLWAGTTTNETAKWADWRDDVRDGVVFVSDEEDGEGRRRRQNLFRLEDDEGTEALPGGLLWRRVESMAEIENCYDQGGWRNFVDVLFPPPL